MTELQKIKDCFLNGIISSRARNGSMDEKCHHDFYDLGINSGTAQHEINLYFKLEEIFVRDQLANGGQLLPNYQDTQSFLTRMSLKYFGCTALVIRSDSVSESKKEIITHEKSKKRRPKRIDLQHGQSKDHQASRRGKNHSDRSKRSFRAESRNPQIDQLHRERQSELLRLATTLEKPA